MKIGIVCPYNLFRHGGVQETIFAHSAILKKRGHVVKILSPRPLSYTDKPPKDVLLIGVSTDLNYPFKTKADISFNAGQSDMRRILDEEQFDILHFHEPWVPLFSRQLLNISKAANVGTFHAKWPEQLIYKTFGKAIRPYARSVVDDLDYVAAASEPGSRYVSELLGREVRIIFNGIDLERFNPDKIKPIKKYQDGKKNILYINRLEKRKGPDLLLKAFRELASSRDDIRLIMASDGDMRPKLETYCKRYGLKNVEFIGFVDDKTKVRLYKTADVYCAPSPYGEGFGIVLLEAMAMRTPYVGGDNVGYRYASGPRADDYLVDPTDAKALAESLEQMLFDEDRRKSYKNWSRKYAAKYDYEAIVSEYEDVYRSLSGTQA